MGKGCSRCSSSKGEMFIERYLIEKSINYIRQKEFSGCFFKRNLKFDFFLPDFKIIIELKANHVWHRNQLKSGLWSAKQKAAEEYSKNNGLLYKILFQEDIDKFFNLLRYSLDCNENYRS
jgi:hypothetical protein